MTIQVSTRTSAHTFVTQFLSEVYDFFQTLELEIEYIWKAKCTPLTALYLFMKYLPFIDVSLVLIGTRVRIL